MHRPSPDAPPLETLGARAVLSAWNVEPALAVALGAVAIVYARGWRRLRARRPTRGGPRQPIAFLAGLGTLFVALASPLDTLADRSLAIHMVQHIVLLAVTPPLLLLGAPLVPLLLGLPAGRSRLLLARAARWLGDWLGHPVVGLLVMSLGTWGWHVPGAFELALRSRAWHVAEHATFLTAGVFFWWPVVRPWPYRARWPPWTAIPYLLLADVQNTALAAILVFSGRVLYPSYGGGAAALDDQVLAGVLMWVPMSFAYLVPAAVLTVRWLSPARHPRPGPTGRGRGSGTPARRRS